MAKKVFVGMSGGVDSSGTAALLKEQGYDVTGVYMKNWSQDLPGFTCPWKEDYQDAKRVAVQLEIPFKMYDFETEYRQYGWEFPERPAVRIRQMEEAVRLILSPPEGVPDIPDLLPIVRLP